MKKITQGQFRFFEHVMRKKALEYRIVTGNVDEKRARCRQRLFCTKELTKHAGKSAMELSQFAENRQEFHDVTVNIREWL